MGYSKAEANAYIGMFLAFNFALHLIAGYLSGRLISNRMLLLISCIFQVIGTHVLSQQNHHNLIYGLSLFLIGCGINSTSLKCILTKLVENSDDNTREMAFFINYSAVNTGFLLGFFAGGYFDLNSNYTQLFNICNFFNVLAIIFLILGWRAYKENQPIFFDTTKKQLSTISCIMLFLFCTVVLGFQFPTFSNLIVVLLGGITLVFLFYQIKTTNVISEQQNIYAFIILTLSSIIFWMLFYIGPMGITYFIKDNLQDTIAGVNIPPQWYMNLNAIFVIIGSPLVAILFQKLKKYGYHVTTSKKFSFAILLIGLSFFVLSIGVLEADSRGNVSSIWASLHYLLQAFGEILIAPVGFAMVGKLAPQRLQGIMMGFWMMVSGVAASLSQFISNMMNYSNAADPIMSNPSYLIFFDNLGGSALFLAVILIIFSKRIERLIS
jgi:POT family proton-dependent oligopeptide transporter/mRNA interferase RelE/StbE